MGTSSPPLMGAGDRWQVGQMAMGLISPRSMVQIHLAPLTSLTAGLFGSRFAIRLLRCVNQGQGAFLQEFALAPSRVRYRRLALPR